MIDHTNLVTKTIALFLPRGHEQSARITAGAAMSAGEYPHITLLEWPYDDSQPDFDYDFSEMEFDGAIIWAYNESPWAKRLLEMGIPVVNCGSNWIRHGVPSVAFDWEALQDDLVEKFTSLGREHAAIVSHNLGNDPFKSAWLDRLIERLDGNNIATQFFIAPGLPSEERQRMFKPAREAEIITFLENLTYPSAIYCDDDYLAALICRVARDLNYRIPQDIAVMGFGNFTISRVASPAISSIEIHGQMIGRQAFQMVRQRLESPETEFPQVQQVRLEFIERDTFRFELVKDAVVAQVNRIIEREACQGINVDELARRLGVSRNTLNRRFQQEYGITPGKKIRAIRVQQAKQMLVNSDHSVTKVAELCGFPEPANFVNFFRREVGQTPNEYRNKAKEPDE